MDVITDNQFDPLKPIHQRNKKHYNEFVLNSEKQMGILSLPIGGTISFFGQIHLVPIQGSFSIYGATLSNQWMLYPAYAPQNQGLILTCTKGSSSASGYELDERHRQVFESLLPQIKNKRHALIGLVGCSDNGLMGIQNMLDTTRHILDNGSVSEVYNIDGFYHVEDPSSSFLSFPVLWEDCVNNLRHKGEIMCIMGAKNSGKSTFARYSLNSLLSTYNSIAFIECDPGQSEFTPPGMVSLNIVSKPCIGPPFTHLHKPIKSFFIGSNTPKQNPDYYMNCLLEVFSEYLNNYRNKMPLMINTQGWIKGMGYDLLKFFLLKVRPKQIIEISNNSQNKMFEDIFAELKNESNIYYIPSLFDPCQKALHSSDHRNLSLISYFCQDTEPTKWNFTEIPTNMIPYKIPWADVTIKFLMHQVPPSQTLYALNGSLVALCINSTNYKMAQSTISIIPNEYDSLYECLGLGLIRSIDKSKQIFYISTPLDPSYFDRINCIVKGPSEGGIDLPPSFRSLSNGLKPYLSFGVVQGLASKPLKTRQMNEEEIESAQRTIEKLLNEQDYYAILNVEPSASEDEISKAYKKWSLIFHPDRQSRSDDPENAARKFQIIQEAYDVLSNRKRREEYDQTRKDSRSSNWTVARKGMEAEEIFDDVIGLNRNDVLEAMERLSPYQGQVEIDIDATKMWKKKPVIPELSFQTRPKEKGFADMINWPEVSNIQIENSWDFNSPFGNGRLDSLTQVRNSLGTANLTGVISREVLPFMTSTVMATVGHTPNLTAIVDYSSRPDRSFRLQASSDTIYSPPIVSMVCKQGLFSNMLGYFVFQTGSYSIFDWGKGYEGLYSSSCTLGINFKVSKTAYDVALTAGSAASQVRVSVVQPVFKGMKCTLQVSLSTASGIKSSFLATKKVTKLIKVTMGVEVASSMGVTFQLRFRRLGRRLVIPILLTDEIRANIIAGALLIPLIGSALVDTFYLKPKKKAAMKKRLEELRDTNSLVLDQRKKEAEEAIQLMQASVTKKVDQEIERNGVVIVEAIYGILPPSTTRERANSFNQSLSPFLPLLHSSKESKFIDVTIPIQNLVSNSQVFISGGFSKSNMIGFYDPCLGEKKRLRIKYRFQERLHWVEIGDRETLALPLREHQMF